MKIETVKAEMSNENWVLQRRMTLLQLMHVKLHTNG